jgi:hypothetical protein
MKHVLGGKNIDFIPDFYIKIHIKLLKISIESMNHMNIADSNMNGGCLYKE